MRIGIGISITRLLQCLCLFRKRFINQMFWSKPPISMFSVSFLYGFENQLYFWNVYTLCYFNFCRVFNSLMELWLLSLKQNYELKEGQSRLNYIILCDFVCFNFYGVTKLSKCLLYLHGTICKIANRKQRGPQKP